MNQHQLTTPRKLSAQPLGDLATPDLNSSALQPEGAVPRDPDLEDPLNPETVEQVAYQISLQRGNGGGGALDDWLEAEKRIRLHRANGGTLEKDLI